MTITETEAIEKRLSFLENMPRYHRTWDEEEEIRNLHRRLYTIRYNERELARKLEAQ